jgi:hypothetical protein
MIHWVFSKKDVIHVEKNASGSMCNHHNDGWHCWWSGS